MSSPILKSIFPRKLSDILSGVDVVSQPVPRGIEINGVTVDSREVKDGFVYVAISGTHSDGHDFIEDAVSAGATVIVAQNGSRMPLDFKGIKVVVASSRAAVSKIAVNIFGNPSAECRVIGVTGTNGKTTTTYMLDHLLTTLGHKVGVLGTIDHHLGEKVWKTELTTPGPLDLQKRLREFVDLGANDIVMEVSSHSLEQGRVSGIEYDGAIFTNLSRDHLDYHFTMEKYFEAKNILFSELLPSSLKEKKVAALNSDDSWVQKVKLSNTVNVFEFGKESKDFRILSIASNMGGNSLRFEFNGNIYDAKVPQVGDFNAYNALAAVACLHGLGHDIDRLLEALTSFKGVPGRLQAFANKDRVGFVDYAHTPDALEKALKSIQQSKSGDDSFKAGRVITVFGCGGDRDKGKRPLMFQVADALSDITIITSDNPRTEEPGKIIEDIQAGIADSDRQSEVRSIPNRKEAIKTAVEISEKFDIILVAGKGHEDYQILGKTKVHFSDSQILEECLNNLR